MDELAKLTQGEYEYLLTRLAGAIQTQRRFIEIIACERVNFFVERYKVKCKGVYYPYLIEELSDIKGKSIFLNLGLVI